MGEGKKLSEAEIKLIRRRSDAARDFPISANIDNPDVILLLDHIAAMEAEQRAAASRTASDAYELGMAMGNFVQEQTARIRLLEGLLKRTLAPLGDAEYDETSSALITEIEQALPQKPDAPGRAQVIETYEWLGHVIADHWRGRVTDDDLRKAFNEYRAACKAAGEPFFILADIDSDDMENIPHGYPDVKPDLPAVKGAYDTPKWKAKRQAVYGKDE